MINESFKHRALAPRLTLYLTQDQSQVFHAIFLENLSCVEIANKLAALVQLSSQHVLDVYIEGPCGIHVLVTDEVVQNMKDESMYTVELLPGKISDVTLYNIQWYLKYLFIFRSN